MKKPLLSIMLVVLSLAASQPARAILYTETYSFSNLNQTVPDGSFTGLANQQTIGSSAIQSVTNVTLSLNVSGGFNGDLYAYVSHSSSQAILLNRSGRTSSNSAGYSDAGFNVTFSDTATNGDIHTYRNTTFPSIGSPLTGTWQPDARNVNPSSSLDTSPRSSYLSALNGTTGGGNWTLFLADVNSGSAAASPSTLVSWGFTLTGQGYGALTFDANTATTGAQDGPGVWDTTTTNWWNGTTNVVWSNTFYDTAVFGNSSGVAGTVNVGTVNANAITFNPASSGSYTLTGGTITLGTPAGGPAPTITTNVNATIASTITGSSGLVKAGSASLTLTGANTYTGATTINRGTLDLGGSTANGSISSSSPLVMGGGTLSYTRTGNTTQTFNGTTFNSGGSRVTVANGDTLNLGALTRNTGATVYFDTTGTITTSTANRDGNTVRTNTNGFLGAFAVYGSYDWASNQSGTGITYFAGYTTYNNVASFPVNADITDNGNGFDGSFTNSNTINSLRFNEGNADSTASINGFNNLTISSGGILVTPSLGAKYARINGGGLTTGSSADLVIQQQNTGSGHLQIGSSIFGSGGLTKAGVGQLDLNGSDSTYTGITTVNGGTMLLAAAITGTSNVTLNNSGTLMLGANDRINNAATVTLNGGTLNTGGFKEGNATGSSAATTGLGALTLSSSSILDFGAGHAGSSVLAFADSHLLAWSGILTLTDFTPNTDFLNFANSAGLTTMQLSEIALTGFTATGLDSFGDVLFTPVPEPSTWVAGIFTVIALGWSQRKRLRASASLSGETENYG